MGREILLRAVAVLFWAALVFTLAFARWRLIEVLQLMPALHRDAELGDWIADCMAAAVTLGAVKFLHKIASSRITAHSSDV